MSVSPRVMLSIWLGVALACAVSARATEALTSEASFNPEVQLAMVTEMEVLDVVEPAIPARQNRLSVTGFTPGRDTAESLRDILGISGSRMGGHGIDPSIRGLSQTQLNVLLDGAYVHGGCPNRMDPPTSYAAAAGYESVTVIKGTQTLAYGGGGPGGTLLFERQTAQFEPNEPVRARVTGAYRSNSDSTDVSADVSMGNAKGYLRLIGHQTQSHDYQDGNGERVRSAYDTVTGTVLLGYTPSSDAKLEWSYDRSDTSDALYPGAGMDSPSARNETLRFEGVWSHLGIFDQIDFEIYRSEVSHVMDNYSLRSMPAMHMRAPSTSNTHGGRLSAAWETVWGNVTLGIDGQYRRRAAQRWNDSPALTGAEPMLNSVLWPEVAIDQTGAFFEFGTNLSDELRLLTGLRFDHVVSEARAVDQDPAGMLLSPEQLYTQYYGEQMDGSRVNDNWGGLIRAEYSPLGKSTLWYAGFARSVRTPDATERYVASNARFPGGRWVGNPNIKPEVHHQLELGVVHEWTAMKVDMSLFVNRVQDYILRDRYLQPMNAATIYRNVEAELIGGELAIAWSLSEAWSLQAGAAWLRGQNLSDDRALHQMPPLEAYAKLSWEGPKWVAGIELQTAAQQTRVDLTSSTGIVGQGLDLQKTPGWAALNLFGRYRVNEHWLIDFGVDNVLDRGYAQHLNRGNAFDPTQIQVNEPGRAAWLRATWEI